MREGMEARMRSRAQPSYGVVRRVNGDEFELIVGADSPFSPFVGPKGVRWVLLSVEMSPAGRFQKLR